MSDLLPAEALRFERVAATARRIFSLHGYGEIETPIVEEAALFARSIGEETDVVGKEMYVFPDRHGVPLALRPEGTAGAVRAYVQHNAGAADPLTRWYYLGPMFRHERPQKGRQRQFHQLGAELFGAAAPEADAELLGMIDALLRELGLRSARLLVNSIGDDVCRPGYVAALQAYLRARKDELCPDCQRRIETNPLRTLDCKVPKDREVLAQAPEVRAHLCEPCKLHFETLLGHLDALGVAHEVAPRLVRGLDYYTRTTFEFEAGGDLGSQNTVAAGGRYDKLVALLGGQVTPAIGFAAGLERLVLALGASAPPASGPELCLVPLGEAAKRLCLQLAAKARAAGVRAELDLRGGSVKSQMRRADKLGAAFVAVVGDDEIASGRAVLKQLAERWEEAMPLEDLAAKVRERLGSSLGKP
ncbi:MAG: histidine--tRNA ligase [Myxococcales bacterium]